MAEPTGATFVTVVHGRHDHLLRQRRLLRQVAPASRHVVVAMGDPAISALLEDDPAVDLVELRDHPFGLPLAAARNAGVARALDRGADLVVLLDVDCLPGRDLLPRYERAARLAPDDLLCGPVTYLAEGVLPDSAEELPALTDPHTARPSPPTGELERGGDHDLFWSLSFAVTPSTWEALGGFCEDYVGYGGEDTDLAWTARDRGIGLTWVGGAHAYHQWHPVSRPPVEHIEAIVRNAHVAHRRWGRWPMRGWLDSFVDRGLVRWTPDGPTLADPAPVPPTIGG